MAIVEELEASAGGRRRLGLKNPADLQPAGAIDVMTAADVNEAVARARLAQKDWGSLAVRERARYLRRAARILAAKRSEYVDVIRRETGKTELECLFMELFAVCDSLTWYAKHAPRVLRERRRRMHLLSPMKKLRLLRRPLGVVGIITPWNGPFVLAANPVVQALVAGNAVLLKPSEVAPYSGKLVGDLFAEAGLPEDLLIVLTGDGETGSALVNADVDRICFTGSVATGRKVGETCGRRLIPCTLELGGKDPMIVCADANLERAARGAVFGSCLNAGQICMAVERVYVAEPVYEAFVERVVELVGELRQGGDDSDIGPIIWPRQLETIERHIADAVDGGATVRVGGKRAPGLAGLYFEPTVITEVNHDMAIMREETFGPIVAVMRVRDEKEAVRLANDSSYGLSSSVWTRDLDNGVEISRRIEAGSACVNDSEVVYGVTEAPFGGLKQSGVGQVNSESGLLGYCHTMPVVIDRFGRDRERMWYPFDAAKQRGMHKAISLLWNTPLGRWMA